jgi:ribonuclease HII
VAMIAEVDEHTGSIQYTFGMKGVIGIDEVGRGPLAGPITVCAVYIEDETRILKDIFHDTIRDSKSISKHLRSNIYQTIRKNRYSNTRVEYAITSKSAAYIDAHGIQKATKDCIEACMISLKKKGIEITQVSVRLDAGLVVPFECAQEQFIKGDERYVEIALASILAKEHRDAYMKNIAKAYSGYEWEYNVGYGTKRHREAILQRGVTKYHRMSYLKAFKHLDKADS